MISSRKLNEVITFYTKEISNSGGFAPIETTKKYRTVHARVWQISTIEFKDANARLSKATTLYNAEVRFDPHITPNMEFSYRGKRINIAEVVEKPGRQELLIKGYEL